MNAISKKALLVVDMQNDFCPSGALGVPEGDRVVPILNKYIEIFRQAGLPIYFTRDWHPPVTVHFKPYGGVWPPHCVQGTHGAEFHPDLAVPPRAVIMSKGDDPKQDSYSAFFGHDEKGRSLAEVLREDGVNHFYIGGLATDYCVKETSLDAIKDGFEVTVLIDGVKGVDLSPGDSERAMEEVKRKGALTATLEDIDLTHEKKRKAG
ncbi:MAG: nicotinamidase [Deltaproteobacteria bacterium GWA2_54_12]|nr:MAG: nicotinamidase [Deltaproteobacteria bacterium GWA2_54_12]